MRALIRGDEIIPENDWTPWIIEHLDWMTTPRPDGDGYTLIEDYHPDDPERTYQLHTNSLPDW